MTPFFSIITPSLQRESLVRCCESVLAQTFTDWEMIIQVDAERIDEKLFSRISPTRQIWVQECGIHHNNFGNTCRHLAWERATGKYLVMLDDDNELASPQTLKQIAKVLKNEPDFAVFPIFRFGHIFFNDPPGLCQTDSGNIVVKREIGRWPDGPEYTMDGIWVEALKAKYEYEAFPNALPIIIMEKSNQGK